ALGVAPAAPAPRIWPPRAVIHPLRHRLAELAIAGNVDAAVPLAAHHLGHRRPQLTAQRRLIICPPRLDQCIRARQTAGMAGQDVVGAAPHDAPRSWCGCSDPTACDADSCVLMRTMPSEISSTWLLSEF